MAPRARGTQTIPVHLNAAKENAERFSELSKEVEVFPRKVASALRAQAQSAGIFETIWNGIKECVPFRPFSHPALISPLRGCAQFVHRDLEGRSPARSESLNLRSLLF